MDRADRWLARRGKKAGTKSQRKAAQLKKNATASYSDRKRVLAELGFDSYLAYLESDLWKQIRGRVLDYPRTLCRCRRVATQVHHARYDARTMRGDDLSALMPVCRDCHGRGSVTKGGVVRSAEDATKVIRKIATSKRRRENRAKRKREG